MFGSLGIPEILFILVLALLIFGPRKLPEIGRTLGRAMGEFRRATTDLKSSLEREVILDERAQNQRRQPPATQQHAAEVTSQEKPAPEAPEPVSEKASDGEPEGAVSSPTEG